MANETNALPIDDEQTHQAAEQPKQETSLNKPVKYTPELCAATINKLPAQLQALKGCFAQPFDAFRKAFKDPAEADRVMAKEIDFAAQAMLANNYLITCAQQNPLDLVNALKNVALTGSTLNPTLKQGYLVPFKGKITFMPSYMGLVDLLANNGLVRKVEAHPVFEGEEFEIKLGTKNYLRHLPNPWGKRDKGNLLGCYYYVVLTDGTEMFDTMSKEEIEKIRQRAPSAKSSSPWDTDYIEMAKKGLALDTLIPTPDGFTTMGEIKVGDKLFNALGEVTTVTSKSEVKHLPCYRVTFQNGDSFVCDHEHRWFVNSIGTGKLIWKVLDARTMAIVRNLGYPLVVPKIEPTVLPDADLSIPPYVLGYWLGNGHKGHASVCCHCDDAEEIASFIRPYYNVSVTRQSNKKCSTLNISSKGGDINSLHVQLCKIKENEGKYIPIEYKRASIAQRVALIQGLCDSDGSILKREHKCKWTTVNKQMALDFFEIVSSLGERASFNSVVAKGFGKEVLSYEIRWIPSNFIPVRLTRKAALCEFKKLNVRNSIKSIEEVGSVPTQCIAVDSFGATEENDLRKSFAIGRGFYITHNTVVRRAYKAIPKGSISDDKVKALEAVFDYDEKTEQSWIAEQKNVPERNPFDEEETEYEEME